jgi:DNA repair exonuclease SbcCD nuclease subunit
MKILIYSDIHISQDSSIVKGLGSKYSIRLENIIKSLNWAEKLATDLNCSYIFNLGDTFDKPIINAMEATAVQDIQWANIPHFVLVGNHDSNVASLEYSSVSVLKSLGFNLISEPNMIMADDVNIYCLPYITESNRKPLKEYITERKGKTIIFSHNDIAGFNFGGFVSKEGFNLNDITENCDLFLNGHLHNSSWLTNKILNVGNLTGQNFSEDAFKYSHGVWVLDTESLQVTFYENPYALNFYKVEINSKNKFLSNYNIKSNAVLMIKCDEKFMFQLSSELNLEAIKKKIVASRILTIYNDDKVEVNNVELTKIDYIEEFKKYILTNIDSSNITKQELAEVFK